MTTQYTLYKEARPDLKITRGFWYHIGRVGENEYLCGNSLAHMEATPIVDWKIPLGSYCNICHSWFLTAHHRAIARARKEV